MQLGMPPRWPGWEPAFAHKRVRWVEALAWQLGLGNVSWPKLVVDYEAFIGRALPASLRGTRLPLGERAQVLHRAAPLVQRHMVAGWMLQGAPTD